jgi:hypothetical protein
VWSFSVSIDGYGAGPGQDLANPLGVGGLGLHGYECMEHLAGESATHVVLVRRG